MNRPDLAHDGIVPIEEFVVCPDCFVPMHLYRSGYLNYTSGVARLYYGCSRRRCRNSVSAHPDGRPVGHVGNVQTKRLRREFHRHFDQFKELSGATTSAIYCMLATWFGRTEPEVHGGVMSDEDLVKATGLLRERSEEFLAQSKYQSVTGRSQDRRMRS